MDEFFCESCEKTFTRDTYASHLKRKRPCKKIVKDVIEGLVQNGDIEIKSNDILNESTEVDESTEKAKSEPLKACYNEGGQIIYNCDCLLGLDALIRDRIEVELTVTSPPYFNVKDYVVYENYKKYLDFLEETFKKIFILTKAGRLCVVNISNILIVRENRNSESRRIPLSFHFVALMEKIGWEFLEDIIWLKPEGAAKNRNGGFFQHRQPVAYKPNVVNENIFVFKKPSNFLIDKVVRSYNSLDSLNSKVTDNYERSNVWKINPKTNSKHPAPYPIELTDNIIRYYSFVGDTVIDPFFGSGTTGLSCHKYNRKCIGYEIHKDYIDIFITRIKNVSPLKLVNVVEIDIEQYTGLNKEDIIHKLMKNPKKMLIEVAKNNNEEVKNNASKIQIANKVYELLFI